MKVSLQKVTLIILFLISVSVKSFWGYGFFHRNPVVTSVVLMIPITLLCLIYVHNNIQMDSVVCGLALSMLAVVLLSSSFSPREGLYYGLCILLLPFSDEDYFYKIPKWFYYAGIVFVFGSLINIFFPNIYSSVILPSFAQSPQFNNLVSWVNNNYNIIIPGFTSQISFNAGYFVYGIGYLFVYYSVFNKLSLNQRLALIFFVVCLVLTNKRAHFLFLFISMCSCFFLWGDSNARGKRFFQLIIMAITSIVFIYILALNVDIGVLRKIRLMLEAYGSKEDITSGRTVLWSIAMNAFLTSPLFGIGWGNYIHLPAIASHPVQVHNIYLQLLCETGIIGFCIFMLFFTYLFCIAVNNCRIAKTNEQKIGSRFCLFVQSFFLMYGLTGNVLFDQPYYIVYFLICAFTLSLQKEFQTADQRALFKTGGMG